MKPLRKYIRNLLKESIDHSKILNISKSIAPSEELVTPIETLHQNLAMLYQYREELKSRYIRIINKHKKKKNIQTEPVIASLETIKNTILCLENSIQNIENQINNLTNIFLSESRNFK